MSFDDLPEQPEARRLLRAAVAEGPAHAYLLHGPAGSGKRQAARTFAAELLARGAKDPQNAKTRVAHGAQWPAVTTTRGAIRVPVQAHSVPLPTAMQSRNMPLGTGSPSMTRDPLSASASARAFAAYRGSRLGLATLAGAADRDRPRAGAAAPPAAT